MTDKPSQPPPSPTPSLAVAATLREGVLQVDYLVRNHSEGPVYLFNGLWLWDSARKTHVAPSTPAYVALRSDGGVHLLLGIPPLPKTRRVGQRIVPFAAKLEAGGVFEQSLAFRLPVREHSPYFPPAAGTTWQAQPTDSLVVTLHYVEALDGLSEAPTSLEGKLQIHHPRLLAEVKSLRSEPQPLAFTAQKQLGDFERF